MTFRSVVRVRQMWFVVAILALALLSGCQMMPGSMSDIYQTTYQTKLGVDKIQTSQGESLRRMEFTLSELDRKVDEQGKAIQELRENLQKQSETQQTSKPAGPSVQLPPMPTQPTEDEVKLYDSANADLDGAKGQDPAKARPMLDSATEKFLRLIATYPNSTKSAEFNYGLGKSYYEKADYERARQAFDRVVTAYPASNIIPQCLHARALCEMKLQQTAQARATVEQIKSSFPNYEPGWVDNFLKSLPPAAH